MEGWKRFASAIGEARIIAVLGGLYVAIATVHVVLLRWAGQSLSDVVPLHLLIGLPGAVLLYGGYRLPGTDLRPDVYSRIVARCLAGIGVMLGVVGLLHIGTPGGLHRPFFTPVAGTSLGSVAGFAIGLNEARALSRAREAEQHRDELRYERDLRERVFETSPIGIAVVGADGAIESINDHAADILGRPKDELAELDNYNHPMFEATDADGNPVQAEETLFRKVLATGDAVYDVERQVARASGERIWLSLNAAPLPSPSGDVTGVIFAFEDITDRKELEEELKGTVNRLEQSNERLREFAYAASHDLQEPLRMISSYLQLLENRYEDDLDDDGREYIEFAVDGADRMRQMIDDLLAYSRLQQRDEAFEPVDCDAVLERVLADLQVQIEENDAEIVAEPLPRVVADGEQLEQVFRNLVSNAIKYNDDEPRIEIAVDRRGARWEFSIADDGIGIPPDEAGRIFEVFNRLHGDEEYPGTGIGLSLCQDIVERHGGEIWVDSEPGEGSTFHFTLPVDAEKRPVAADSGSHPEEG